MSDELFLEGKNYMSSKRAAQSTGYAQDYIGQLARGGLIDAQRVGGLWYVSLDSLSAYQKNAEEYKPVVPAPKQASDIDSIVSFDGKDYLSASRAAKLTGYNQDYIGQLARGGKILSRQIGNRWYIEREGLIAHKSQKDSLLAAVQSEAAGLLIPAAHPGTLHSVPTLNYTSDDRDLMPKLMEKPESAPDSVSKQHIIPIRVVRQPIQTLSEAPLTIPRTRAVVVRKKYDMTISRAIGAGVALTFVIVLSYGFATFKEKSVYTFNFNNGIKAVSQNALTAAASGALDGITAAIERLVSPEIKYSRDNQ